MSVVSYAVTQENCGQKNSADNKDSALQHETAEIEMVKETL